MGRQSTRANKNIYQICREECELTREKASEMMTGVSASRIEKSLFMVYTPKRRNKQCYFYMFKVYF